MQRYLLLLLLGSSISYGMPSSSVPFFLRPDSLFSSGQAPLKALEEGQLTQATQPWLLVQNGSARKWLQASQLILSLESSRLVKLKKPAFLMKEPIEPGLALEALDGTLSLELLKIQGPWAQVRWIEKNRSGWVMTQSLVANENDRGVIFTVVPTQLFKNVNLTGPTVVVLPPHQRLKVHRVFEFSALVQTDRFFGYVDLRQTISRFDFAYEVKNSLGQWKTIHHRRGPVLFLQDGAMMHYRHVTSLRTREDLGIILQDPTWPIRSRVQILKGHLDRWIMSRLPDHGPIWWKANATELPALLFTTENVLKRPLHAAAFSENRESLSLISAQGIFLSEDGKLWRKIDMFKDQDFPVAISRRGPLYVGPYVSHDRGFQFQEYIRWETLTQVLHEKTGTPPRYLKLLDLKISGAKSDVISLHIDTGNKKIWLESNATFSQWSTRP